MIGRRIAATALMASIVACAIQGPPPGGPPDRVAPALIAVLPDSMVAHPDFRGSVELRFDEVVSEGGQVNFGLGTGDLEKLIILSPSPSVPSVRWGRRAILVRPREGWRPNTTYRVELLPGVGDVRNNRSKLGALLTFRTGGDAPDYTLRGQLYDWTNGSELRGALVEAVPAGDTTGYRAVADSSGAFVLGPLPRGEYVVYGIVDANRNNRRDPREAFDSLRVSNDSGAVGELWTFPHDTLPARLARLDPIDTTGASVTLSLPLDPALQLDSSMVRVRLLPDSVDVPVAALLFGLQGDSARQVQRAVEAPREDTTAAARGTAAAPPVRPRDVAPARKGSRKALESRLVVLFQKAGKPGDRFVLDFTGLRTVSGTTGTARGVLVFPAPLPAVKAGRQAAGAPDSTATRDSVS